MIQGRTMNSKKYPTSGGRPARATKIPSVITPLLKGKVRNTIQQTTATT
jgi:hypothetical protein